MGQPPAVIMPDEWQKLPEEVENRLALMEAQMKQHMEQQQQQQQKQMAGSELVEKQLADWDASIELMQRRFAEREAGIELMQRQFADAEERFMTAVDTRIVRRMRRMEEDIRELTQAGQLVTPVFSDKQSQRLDLQSPCLDSFQPPPQPCSVSDSEDSIAQEVHSHSTFRNGMQWAGASIRGITTPVLSSRRGGLPPDKHNGSPNSLEGIKQNARYQACIWP